VHLQAQVREDIAQGYSPSTQKRKQLVRMVQEEGQSIANSIKKLKIKLTTARLILQKYKETGTYPMRKFKKVGKMMLDLPG
jgi:transposase